MQRFGRSTERQAVILAGGKGTRLAPFTTVVPKPLLPMGDKPMLEVLLGQLAHHRFTHVTLATGYLAHLFEAVLQDGSRQGVSLTYHREREPLGTVGPLSTIDNLNDTFLMMNADVLTMLDFDALFAAHVCSGNALTVATHVRTVRSDYGVLDLDGDNGHTRRVTAFREKPAVQHPISMGVYVVEAAVRHFLPAGERFDMPDLVSALLDAGERVGAFPYEGFWLDVGRHEDYQRAVGDFEAHREGFLPGSGPRNGTSSPPLDALGGVVDAAR